jgi:hypothetical protein
MKPALLESHPSALREENATQPDKARLRPKRLARGRRLDWLAVVFQIGGGKNRALAPDAQLAGWISRQEATAGMERPSDCEPNAANMTDIGR